MTQSKTRVRNSLTIKGGWQRTLWVRTLSRWCNIPSDSSGNSPGTLLFVHLFLSLGIDRESELTRESTVRTLTRWSFTYKIRGQFDGSTTTFLVSTRKGHVRTRLHVNTWFMSTRNWILPRCRVILVTSNLCSIQLLRKLCGSDVVSNRRRWNLHEPCV